MKKSIFSALAAGALLAGGAVHAQDLPSQILGAILGSPGYVQNGSGNFTHREGDRPYEIQRDSAGRLYYFDHWGRMVFVGDANATGVSPGVNAYGVPYAYGVPQPYVNQPYVNPNRGNRDRDRDGIANRYDTDRDGDGVRNRNDRYPNDRRYR